MLLMMVLGTDSGGSSPVLNFKIIIGVPVQRTIQSLQYISENAVYMWRFMNVGAYLCYTRPDANDVVERSHCGRSKEVENN